MERKGAKDTGGERMERKEKEGWSRKGWERRKEKVERTERVRKVSGEMRQKCRRRCRSVQRTVLWKEEEE